MDSAKHTGEENDKLDSVISRMETLFREIFAHDGYGSLEVSMRFLKRGQKEILLRCGKEYRYVVDYPATHNQDEKPGV